MVMGGGVSRDILEVMGWFLLVKGRGERFEDEIEDEEDS